MKVKSITIATSIALYGACSIASAQSLAGTQPSTIDMMELYKAQKEAQQFKQDSATVPLRQNDLANIQFKPRTSETKMIAEPGLTGKHTYIVRLHDKSVATYDGNIPGLQATKASKSAHKTKLFTASKATGAPQASIDAYNNHLLNKQQQLIQKASSKGIGLQVRQQFTIAINAISVELTQEEAKRLAGLSEVAYVQRSKMYELHSDAGPEHVGAGGVWNGTTTASGGKFQGEGMVVGIIDTGVNTDHPSFAAVGGDGYAHTNPLGEGNYLGGCAEEEFAARCNDKLIGVYTHESITDNYEGMAPEFGEDFEGHGSHVASTVAGNVLYDVDVVGSQLGGGAGTPIGVQMPRISGVAPHANIISYQVCMQGEGCSGEAMVFAIEQAIKDGVDAINMSIGGSESFPWDDAFEMAFLSAREAGVAVALSAGNSGSSRGPDSIYTVDHTSPWVLNVAATTHARSIKIEGKALEGFSGGDASLIPDSLDGAGISTDFTGEFVLAADYGDGRCNTPFAPGTFSASQIVVCERGDIARVNKAVNAAAGGAGAFVLYNTSAEGDQIADDAYVIPGIHITNKQWQGNWQVKGLKPWLESGTGLTGTITASTATREINPDDADWVAGFSSRGPSSTVDELFSPGIAAPGVDIFAAWNDENPLNASADTRNFNAISGTSMASPHVAGMMTLIRQAQPEWTASQVQSALQMTADSKVLKTPHPMTGETKVAGVYRAGHGLANVERAINAGLIMDETADNFRRANPHNGGRVRDLNLPQLINNDCGRACSWVRTVTASRDGSWTVNVNPASEAPLFWDYSLDPSAKVTVSPSSFSLKAGESITLTVTGAFEESDMAWYEGTVQTTQGEIEFVSDDEAIPTSQWPYMATYRGTTLPNTVNITANDNVASHTISDVPFGVPASKLSGVAYAPVESTVTEFSLPRLQFNTSMVDNEGYWDTKLENITTVDVTVPENAALFRAEMLGRVKSKPEHALANYADADLMIFRDYNKDGKFHYSEAICGSQLPQTTKGEFCALENPEAGDYTIMVMNYLLYPWESVDTYKMAHVVVTKNQTSEINMAFEQSADEELNSSLTVDWNMEMEPGKTYYSAAAVQAGDNAEGSLAMVPLTFKRGVNTVSINSSQDAAQVGDIIDITMLVQANKSGADRAIDLSAVLSDGLKMVPGSLKSVEGLIETENGFTLAAAQVNSSAWETKYKMTTNAEDAMCRTPWDIDYLNGTPIEGKYVDLIKFGITPSWGSFFEANEWGGGNWVHDLPIPTINGELAPFDNEDYFVTDQIVVSSRGWLQLDYLQYNPWDIALHQIHLELPSTGYSVPPDYVVAPFWNAQLDPMTWQQEWTLSMYQPHWDPEQQKGVSIAYYDGYTLVEWDNAQTHDKYWDFDTFQNVVSPRDDSYDFQTFLREKTSHENGKFEVIMAYDNVDFATQDGSGSIGLRGYNGPRAGFWPLNGHSGASLAYNNLDEKVQSGLVVCYDVVSPESTQVAVSFKAEVKHAALGVDQLVSVSGNVEGVSDANADMAIAVASNITMASIANQVVDRKATLSGIAVNYADNDGGVSVNTISVSGKHITAVVNGHTSGSTIDITPDASFHGETLVTVTVADKLFPNDKASISFMLMVNQVASEAPVATVANSVITVEHGMEVTLDASSSRDVDGDALIYSWTQISGNEVMLSGSDNAIATINAGSLETGESVFEVTVSDGELSSTAQVSVTVSAATDPAPAPEDKPAPAPEDKPAPAPEDKPENEPQSGDKTGGSFGWLLAALAFVSLGRRKKKLC